MVGSALYAAISGLKSQQVKLDVIANNVANINTYGFKGARVAFSDLLSQTLRSASGPQSGRGGTNPVQVGVGVQLSAIDTLTAQGSVQTTGNLTDLAINGEGYFIVSNGTALVYTRAGNFSLDADGGLITSNGYRIQGFTQRNSAGEIDTSTTLNDVIVNFGEKLAGRPTSLIDYASNLDSSSYTYGSAELVTAGSTGFTVAAGIAIPIASYTGAQVDNGIINGPLGNLDAGLGDLTLNGQDIIFTFPPGFVWGDSVTVAQYVADQINSQSSVIYARAGENGELLLQNIIGGANNDIVIAGNAAYLALIGLAAGTFQAPPPDSSLAGFHTMTVTDSVAATDTTTIPTAAGALVAGSFDIYGIVGGVPGAVTISYGATSASNTSAQNAQVIADAINAENDINPNFFISATANANGTLTLTSDYAGKSNQIIISNPGAAALHLDTLGTFDGVNYVVDNGSDASVENIFKSDDGLVSWTRTVSDRTPFGTASTLTNLETLILGDNPPFQLIPGVTLTAENLFPGQATVQTFDAFEHQTSINVFDSNSNEHQLKILFKHTGAGEWEWTATLPNEPQYTLTNNTGVINFGTNGLLLSGNPTIPIMFTPVGADAVRIFPNFDGEGSPINGITQFASNSTTAAKSQDGYPMGILQAYGFDPSGTLQGVYSNGLTQPLARLALAVFANPAGLHRTGDNTWISTQNSGLARVAIPRESGAGEILAGSLEQSNVDAATEFTELIVAQRSFQACSRVITAQDAILQEVVNLVR
ncbi:MAG: flagellar hook-basal body complex protein [bacterium]|nr:flagellar hook-basal body complex protein [bacterium]